jgi:hypothetical protein
MITAVAFPRSGRMKLEAFSETGRTGTNQRRSAFLGHDFFSSLQSLQFSVETSFLH